MKTFVLVLSLTGLFLLTWWPSLFHSCPCTSAVFLIYGTRGSVLFRPWFEEWAANVKLSWTIPVLPQHQPLMQLYRWFALVLEWKLFIAVLQSPCKIVWKMILCTRLCTLCLCTWRTHMSLVWLAPFIISAHVTRIFYKAVEYAWCRVGNPVRKVFVLYDFAPISHWVGSKSFEWLGSKSLESVLSGPDCTRIK